HWSALAVWHQAMMWIDRRAGAAPQAPAVASLFRALAATGRSLLDRLDGLADAEADALSTGLRRDLQWLVGYPGDPAATPGARGAKAECVRSARERLDDLWALAEHGSHDEGRSTLTARSPDGVIEAQGILVSSIGLHAASRTDDVHLAAAHLQAFEALGFVAHLGVAGREGSRVARALTAEAPERDHYRLAADIAERRRVRRTRPQPGRSATPPAAGPAAPDDAASSERILIDGLYDASGSDFAPPSSEVSRRSAQREGGSAQRTSARSRIQHWIRHRPLPLRRRVDPVLLGGLTAAAIVYCVATATLVLLFGWVDTAHWSARSLPDSRLLENVRRQLDTEPFLDAIFHAPDGQLVVSQQGGVFHSYDPDTGLWSTVRPFAPNDLARPDVRLLAS